MIGLLRSQEGLCYRRDRNFFRSSNSLQLGGRPPPALKFNSYLDTDMEVDIDKDVDMDNIIDVDKATCVKVQFRWIRGGTQRHAHGHGHWTVDTDMDMDMVKRI